MSLSTHVLDTASGRPAAGLTVKLQTRTEDGKRWTTLSEGVTNDDGRVPGFTEGIEVGAATYRMVFETEAWFTAQGLTGFYPYVHVVFTIRAPDEHYHVPLLLSPYGYSTYRGS